MSSCHHVIPSYGHIVIWSSGHQVIRSSGHPGHHDIITHHHDETTSTVTRTHERTHNIRIYMSASQTITSHAGKTGKWKYWRYIKVSVVFSKCLIVENMECCFRVENSDPYQFHFLPPCVTCRPRCRPAMAAGYRQQHAACSCWLTAALQAAQFYNLTSYTLSYG